MNMFSLVEYSSVKGPDMMNMYMHVMCTVYRSQTFIINKPYGREEGKITLMGLGQEKEFKYFDQNKQFRV